ncbi:methyl-accepting chemotaxis protein [Hydrogenophaga defluvii]|uniref:Methyl-accepting chemotaxis protein n=1 Tax=Hydrogenophaga defluvii TaxID=249410 RepID=A0ABW2SF08_9BURK
MSFLSRFRVGALLTTSFILVAALSLVVGGVALFNMQRMNEAAKTSYESDLVGLSLTKEANINLLYIGRDVRNAILASTKEQREAALAGIQKNMAQARSLMDRAKPLFYSERGRAMFAELDTQWQTYQKEVDNISRSIAGEELSQARKSTDLLFTDFKRQVDVVDKLMTELTVVKENNAERLFKESVESYNTTFWTMVVLVAGALLVGMALGMLISRNITRQLGGEPAYAVDVATSIAQGDLARSIDVRPGDSSSIVAAMAAMRQQLANVVGQVRQASDSIATGSQQIASGTQDLSQRTEEQASNLEETAASMEELTGTVRSNADTAEQANKLAQQTSDAANNGGEKVGRVVSTMQGIADSSRRIADIIGVIDGIAFQTNILALNAAVEAARAGEQGRGFAVVASEVRNLAQRSASAAKEIKDLIGQSVGQVEQGTVIASEAGAAMQDIVDRVRNVSQLIREISAATAEQTTGIEQVGTAVMQMDQVTQQNAALVEESAAAADSLRAQAARLTEVVNVFKLEGGTGTSYGTSQAALHAVTPAPVGQHSAGRRLGAPGGEQLALAR